MGGSSFLMFIHARSEQCDLGPIDTITNTQLIRTYPGKLKFILVKISPDPGRLHGKHAKENQTLFAFRTTTNLSGLHCSHECKYSVFRFFQLCCKFTHVNAFTLWYKWVGAYLGNYLSTVFCVLIFIRIDPKMLRLKTNQTINTDKYLQGFAVYQSKFAWYKRGLNWRPSLSLNLQKMIKSCSLHDFCLIFSCFNSE